MGTDNFLQGRGDEPQTDLAQIEAIFVNRGFVYVKKENAPEDGLTMLRLEAAGVEMTFDKEGRLGQIGTMSMLEMFAVDAENATRADPPTSEG